jgi:hypothetical protein
MSTGSGSLLAPLDRYYAAAGLAAPTAEVVTTSGLPPDARELLTAPGPLTPRLEHHHGAVLTLRVLDRRRNGDEYARRVVLADPEGVPVLLGAIAVDLARLPPAARAAVVAERLPFGHIVTSGMTKPAALLRIGCDASIAAALDLPGDDGWLYGRRRSVIDERAATVATIVDVLAPIPTRRGVCRGSA